MPAPTTQSSPMFPRMHVSLYVQDVQRSVAFYDAFFNQPASKVQPGYAKYELAAPGLIISFVENAEAVQPQFGHLGIQVDNEAELHRRLAEAREKELPHWEEMGTNCCYARQDKFWVSDPDGHQWEVYLFHEDVAFNDPHYAHPSGADAQEDAQACCSPVQLTWAEKPKKRLAGLGK